jgi:hypothetical protein
MEMAIEKLTLPYEQEFFRVVIGTVILASARLSLQALIGYTKKSKNLCFTGFARLSMFQTPTVAWSMRSTRRSMTF